MDFHLNDLQAVRTPACTCELSGFSTADFKRSRASIERMEVDWNEKSGKFSTVSIRQPQEKSTQIFSSSLSNTFEHFRTSAGASSKVHCPAESDFAALISELFCFEKRR